MLSRVFPYIRLRVFANAEIQCEESVSAYCCRLLSNFTLRFGVVILTYLGFAVKFFMRVLKSSILLGIPLLSAFHEYRRILQPFSITDVFIICQMVEFFINAGGESRGSHA